MNRRAFSSWLLLAAGIVIPTHPAAQAAIVRIQEEYEWPGRCVLRCALSQGDLLVVSRGEQEIPAGGSGHADLVLGASLPWMLFGPLLTRGVLRMAADPLSFSAWSGVFAERTGVVLDSSLRTSRTGAALMPVPESCGVYCRTGSAGEMEYGAFGRLPLGTAAAAECALVRSRPDPPAPVDEWFLERSPFPGGDLTHVAARLVLGSPFLDFCCAAGASSAQFAAPGAFSTLWMRGRLSEIEAAFLLSGATPAYRTPEGTGTTGASRVSGTLRLGRNRRRGSIEAGFSATGAERGFAPSREIPTCHVVRAAFSRDFDVGTAWPVSLLLDAQKNISRDPDGLRQETSSCGATAGLSLKSIDLAAGAEISDQDGVDAFARADLTPSAFLRFGVEARGRRLSTSEAGGSMTMKLLVHDAERSAALVAGLEGCPLDGHMPRPIAEFLTVSLSCSVSFR